MAKKVKEEKTETLIVTFNYGNKIENVFTGKEELYHIETRDNIMDSTNYIVQTVDQEHHTIEYEIHSQIYCRFEPEPEISLYDYLNWKYCITEKHVMDARYKDTVWTCPDTNETYSYAKIKKDYLHRLKALNGETTK